MRRQVLAGQVAKTTTRIFSLNLFLPLVLAGCSSSPTDARSSAVKRPRLHPEMVVSLDPKGFDLSCGSEALLNELIGHLHDGEKTKAQLMLDNVDCQRISSTHKAHILSVKKDAEFDTYAVEFIYDGYPNMLSQWTVDKAFNLPPA